MSGFRDLNWYLREPKPLTKSMVRILGKVRWVLNASDTAWLADCPECGRKEVLLAERKLVRPFGVQCIHCGRFSPCP